MICAAIDRVIKPYDVKVTASGVFSSTSVTRVLYSELSGLRRHKSMHAASRMPRRYSLDGQSMPGEFPACVREESAGIRHLRPVMDGTIKAMVEVLRTEGPRKCNVSLSCCLICCWAQINL
jgi:hypothetical protein